MRVRKVWMTFRALFCIFRCFHTPAQLMALPAVSQEDRMPHRSVLPYPPRCEVCGGTGWIISEAVGSGLTSHNLRHCVGPAAWEKHIPQSQPEGLQDTRGLCRSRVERSCPQQSNTDRVQSPHAVSYSPSYNSKQRQTLSAQYSLTSKSCNFRAFSGRDNGENGLFYQKSGRNSCLCHWADHAHLNIICKNKE